MKKYSALIIDDSETDRYLLKRFLLKTNLVSDIIEFNNGKDALDYLSQNNDTPLSPDLIYLDLNMPLMGGFEFLDNYKTLLSRNTASDNSHIFVLSSSENEDDKNQSISYQFVSEYVIKGKFNSDDLKLKINKYV